MKLSVVLAVLSGTAVWATSHKMPSYPSKHNYENQVEESAPEKPKMEYGAPAAHETKAAHQMEEVQEYPSPTEKAEHSAPVHAAGATHSVVVGGEGLIYDPPHVVGAVGDVIIFTFLAKNHTLTQSTFDNPCKKMEGGIDSGFMPNANGTEPAPTFEIPIKSTEPSWWYCKQKTPKNHCTSGMVFAVNPNKEKTFEAFLEKAKAGAAEAPEAPPADEAAPPPGNALTLSVDNNGVTPPSATPVAPPPVASPTEIAAGWNQGADPAACNCACFCGASSFPPGNGVGAYGGLAGSMPRAW